MTPFTALTSVAAPLRLANLDTDQIIPARFLRHPRNPGYGGFLFHDLRFDGDGQERGDFVLNRPPFRQARILVAGSNFGGGSSREGAVFALADFGIRCVIAPSFGQIFYKNCVGNGVLPARLAEDAIDGLLAATEAETGTGGARPLCVDLEAQQITAPQTGAAASFEIEPFFREMLLRGLNEIGMTQAHHAEIEAFEAAYLHRFPHIGGPG